MQGDSATIPATDRRHILAKISTGIRAIEETIKYAKQIPITVQQHD
ncbi:MAG: hypothetical protein ACREAS_06400 [Nitrososphaera sp.]